MQSKIQTLYNNYTWDLVPHLPRKKPLSSYWLYKVKIKDDVNIERCKVRLVAKGFN